MKTTFLVLSAVITFVGVVPYLLDIIKGKTKPNLVSWITWTLLTGIATAAEIAAHEYVAAIFTAAAATETGAVVVFGLLKRAYVRYTKFDVVCQLSAVVGIVLWQVYNSPEIGIVASVTIDFIGALPSIRHSWIKPYEETWQTYALSGLGGVLAMFALSTYNWASLPYPLYIVIINTVFPLVILYRRTRVGVK